MRRRKTNGKRKARLAACPFTSRQNDLNRSTAENWASFAPHRKRVTDLIVGHCFRQDSRLAVLGAGNCNDLDLETLTASFALVDLFDLDAKALARGIRAQSMDHLHASTRMAALISPASSHGWRRCGRSRTSRRIWWSLSISQLVFRNSRMAQDMR